MIIGDLVDQGFAEIKTGPFGTQLRASDYVDSGRPVLNVRNVGFGDVRADKLEYIDEATAKRLSTHLLVPGDIIFGRKGAVERHALIGQEFSGAIQGSDCIRLRVSDKSPVPASFITFALRTAEHQAWMKAFCSHGATMASLNQEILRQVPLPDLAREQQDLAVAVLQTIDDLIDNGRRRVEVLEKMASTIYREWFVHFRYPGHETAAMVDSPFGLIPDKWERTALTDLVDTQYGYTESASDVEIGPRYLRGMDINKHSYIDWSTVPYCPIDDTLLSKFRINVGDIFVIRMADPGKVGICEIETNAVFASYLVRLRPSSDLISPYFLFFTLSADEYQGWVTGASTGATRKSVSAKVMTEPRIVLPPRRVQQEFEELIRPIRSLMTQLVEQNSTLSALRDRLLPKLVTGRIDVSSLDLDVLVDESVA
jgi:type I restriction enzyme S subunit